MTTTDTILKQHLATLIESLGYEFVGSVLQGQSRQAVLRIYIDKTGGVTVDDCSRVSRQVGAMLDVEDLISGSYTLEVSSPGLDRPLFELAQYEKFLGRYAKIRVHTPIDNQRNFVGVLLRIEKMNVYLLTEQGEIVLPFADIEKAKLIADIG